MREKLGRNLIVLNGVVKCRIKRAGKFHEWTAKYQGNHAYTVDADGVKRPKAALLKWLAECEAAITEKRWEAIRATHIRGGSATIGQIVRAYQGAAERQRAKYGVPQPHTVVLATSRLLMICKGVGLAESDALDKLTPDVIDRWISQRVEDTTTAERPREKAMATAAAILNSAKGVFSRWAKDYYRMENIELPECVGKWPRPKVTYRVQYKDPPLSLKTATVEAAKDLRKNNPKVWILFHVLISFGCRPGDALKLTDDHFVMMPGPKGKPRRTLVYRPHKTSNKNSKQVYQPVPERVWNELEEARLEAGDDSGFIVPTIHGNRGRATVLEQLNTWLREVGWKKETYHAGAYNLRALFTSAVLNKFGLAVASAYCGSSEKMVAQHYGALYTDKLPEIDALKVIGG